MRRRARGDRGEHDVAGGHRELVGVVLADAEEVDPDPVGEHALLDHAADRVRVRQRPSVSVVDQVAEGVEAEHERERQRRAVLSGFGVCGGHIGLRFYVLAPDD